MLHLDHDATMAVLTDLWNALNWHGIVGAALNMIVAWLILKILGKPQDRRINV